MSGHQVRGWDNDGNQREALIRDRENRKYLPGLTLPFGLEVTDTAEEALRESEMVLLVVPSHALRGTVRGTAGVIGTKTVVNAGKGLEEGTNLLMLQVLGEELGKGHPTASMVGPSHAEEVAKNFPTAVVAASTNPETAEMVQRVFSDETFRVYTNDDTLGVELAVALKNVIALASGIAVGLGYGDNTTGALLTRGLAEMTRLGVRLGARPETFFGLAGVGDLVTTACSRHSRNRRVGEAVGRGQSLDEALAGMTMVAEGVRTTKAARALAREHRVEMPIVDRVYAVLFEGESPHQAIRDLMTREPKSEETAPNI
jgi:glycerol-3-phosphate dehydrogenase (NAD(P)+)